MLLSVFGAPAANASSTSSIDSAAPTAQSSAAIPSGSSNSSDDSSAQPAQTEQSASNPTNTSNATKPQQAASGDPSSKPEATGLGASASAVSASNASQSQVSTQDDDSQGTVVIEAWNRDHPQDDPVTVTVTAAVGSSVNLRTPIEQKTNKDTFFGATPSYKVTENGSQKTYYYHLIGWNTERDGSGQPLTTSTGTGYSDDYTVEPGTHHFYFIWNKYAVDFQGVVPKADGSGDTRYNAFAKTGVDHLGDSITLPQPGQTSKWMNATFLGWNTKLDGTGTTYQPGDTFVTPSGESEYDQMPIDFAGERPRLGVTLYGRWQYVVSFDAGEGTTSAPDQTFPISQNGLSFFTPTQPADPTRPGYKFLGWFQPNARYAYNFSATLMTSTTFTAHWAPIVDFTAGTGHDADDPADAAANADGKVTLPAAPSKTFNQGGTDYRYVFLGWQADGEELLNGAGSSVSVDGPTSFTGKWAKYRLTLEPGTEANGDSQKVAYLGGDLPDSIELPAAPSTYAKDKYHFAGWQVNGEGKTYQPGEKFQAKDDMVTGVDSETRANEPYAQIVLTAAWEKDATSEEPSTGDNGSNGTVSNGNDSDGTASDQTGSAADKAGNKAGNKAKAADAQSRLASTGSATMPLLVVSLMLMAAGAAAWIAMRRRD